MVKPPANSIAGDFRALLGDAKIRLPVAADAAAPGYITDKAGLRVAAVNIKIVDSDPKRATALARAIAGAINWQAGEEVR